MSPEDLTAAAALWPSLGVPLATRKLRRSGAVVVVEADGGDGGRSSGEDEAVRALMALPRLRECAGRGMTVDAIAAELDVAVMMAMELVADAEEHGRLCRDDQAAEGVAFYRNFFLDGEQQPG